ncbi:unnamed protein product [Adineta steineri]|uniref:EGF-like domain-containing protein n=1 Tax=Adineta steineri TaxID=433720 RepID=A0A815A291_9BILA|nr:unnamed protein product [Adineta steineri]CAF3788618.1 unnamed protein product [Adineta steineri]
MVLLIEYKLWIIMMILKQLSAVSYNQPKICPNASWELNGTTFATNYGPGPYSGIFINTNNTIYIPNNVSGSIQIWSNESLNPSTTISANLSNPYSIFVTTNGDIYVDNAYSYGRVDKWTNNGSNRSTAMFVNSACYGLFIDTNDTLYCSTSNRNQVVKKLLNDSSSTLAIAAGKNISGSTSDMLQNPYGIFVDVNFDLYVADCGNDRIQLFSLGQLNGTTVAGNGSVNPTGILNCPRGIVLDAHNQLYIVDSTNHRIIRLGPNGFQCIIGCSNQSGSTPDKLNLPRTLYFDSYGNIFVTDYKNNRTQKFRLLNNSCDDHTTQQSIMTTTMAGVSSSSTIINQNLLTTDTTVFDQKGTTNQETTSGMSSLISITRTTSLSKTIYETSSMTNHYAQSLSLLPFFVAPPCSNEYKIGMNCNSSIAPCDILNPCQNYGTCFNNNETLYGYTCSCTSDFSGSECEINTCWNNGTCIERTAASFNCSCQSGWQGLHCEIKINYCENVTCFNSGICRSLLLDYTCECLSKSFTGRHCEITQETMVIHQMVSKSIGYISIIFIVGVCMFFVIMDIFKYCFRIDPAKSQLKKTQQKKRPKKAKRPLIIQKFAYVNASPLKAKIQEELSVVKKTNI